MRKQNDDIFCSSKNSMKWMKRCFWSMNEDEECGWVQNCLPLANSNYNWIKNLTDKNNHKCRVSAHKHSILALYIQLDNCQDITSLV